MGLANDSPLLKDKVSNGDSTGPSTVHHVRSFFSCPTQDSWNKIGKSDRKSLIKTVVSEDLLPDADKVCQTFVQTCYALQGDNEALQDLAECILGPAFTSESMVAESVISTLLVYMGLLKAELKVEKVESLKGPLNGLYSIITQEFFPRS